jgi:DNA-binding MarR family transcriptional regulator
MIMKNEQQLLQIRTLFIGIVNKLNRLEKTPRQYGTDEVLYASEIQAIETLGYHPGLNVTEFAEKHGVTKGAVSQLIKKLAHKGLVTRYKDPLNQKEVLLKLTTKGEIAFHQHTLFHLQFAQEFFDAFETMPAEHIQAIIKFLATLDELFDRAFAMEESRTT